MCQVLQEVIQSSAQRRFRNTGELRNHGHLPQADSGFCSASDLITVDKPLKHVNTYPSKRQFGPYPQQRVDILCITISMGIPCWYWCWIRLGYTSSINENYVLAEWPVAGEVGRRFLHGSDCRETQSSLGHMNHRSQLPYSHLTFMSTMYFRPKTKTSSCPLLWPSSSLMLSLAHTACHLPGVLGAPGPSGSYSLVTNGCEIGEEDNIIANKQNNKGFVSSNLDGDCRTNRRS